MRALLIDDEPAARAALRGLLLDHPQVEVVGEADNLESAASLLASAEYDLVFLDIQLRGGSGFDLVPLVRAEAQIVFVTAFDRYAVRAFEVNALDFLLKPIPPDRLATTLSRVAPIPAPTPPEPSPPTPPPFALTDLVHFKVGNGTTRFIPLTEIAAISANENYSEAHLNDGQRLFVRRTMKAWEDALPPSHFVRVHRGMIINLLHYRGSDRQTEQTTLLHVAGLEATVRASFRYLPDLRSRLLALGQKL